MILILLNSISGKISMTKRRLMFARLGNKRRVGLPRVQSDGSFSIMIIGRLYTFVRIC